MRAVQMFCGAAGMIAALTFVAAAHAQNSDPASPPPAPRAVSPEVDEILTRIENRKVADLHAKLAWSTIDPLDPPGTPPDRKRGEIWYSTKTPVPAFLIRFRDRSSHGRSDKIDEQYLFDGEWYVELINKVVTRRQVRTQKDRANPYRLGEGPFPVPFGQTKADILRELEVGIAPNESDDPKDTDHLLLTPRPGTQMAGKYGAIHFWVKRKGKETGLPVKVQLDKLEGTGRVGNYMIIEFTEPELDRGVRPGVFEIKTPAGAEEIVEPLEQ